MVERAYLVSRLLGVKAKWGVRAFAKAVKTRQNPNSTLHDLFALKSEYDDVYFNNVDEYYLNNTSYGNAKVLRRFSGFDQPLPCAIEHGLYFGDYILPADYKTGFKNIVTYSDYRKDIIERKTNCQAHPVGPYICYADASLGDDELAAYRTSLGKTLSVFPTHSITTCRVSYDAAEFLSAIEGVKRDGKFNTIIVCLSYRDLDLASFYRGRGCEVTCVGHGRDPRFLSRLKSLLSVTDLAVSNTVGTNLGYAVACGVPYYCFDQKNTYKGNLDDLNPETAGATLELMGAFGEPVDMISEKQREIVDHYFGLSNVLDKRGLHSLFESFQKETMR